MLKINTKSNKFCIPLLILAISIGGIFLCQYLTFIPEYSSATTIETVTPVTPTTPLAKWKDLEYMQQMTPQACADASTNATATLTDYSSGTNPKKKYNVQKIGSECWMTQNMDNEAGRIYQHATYGGYYNWANAKTVCAKMGEGWELPSQVQYQSIVNNYSNGELLIASSYKFLYGGVSDGGSPDYAGSYGVYWSSTPNGSYAYTLYLDSSNANLDYSNTFGGYSVRCVAKTSSTTTPVTPPNPTLSDPTLSVTIPKILTLDVTDSVNIETNPNNISTGTFTATVTSNSSYNIALSTITNGHTDLINDKTPTASIPALSSTITTSNNKWWGIKCTNTTNTNCTKPNYTGLTTTPEIYYSSSTSTSSTPTIFNIGIQTSPDLPSGTYSTSILVTASQN